MFLHKNIFGAIIAYKVWNLKYLNLNSCNFDVKDTIIIIIIWWWWLGTPHEIWSGSFHEFMIDILKLYIYICVCVCVCIIYPEIEKKCNFFLFI